MGKHRETDTEDRNDRADADSEAQHRDDC
jgi:hypothetical protein